jgi:hypothetical protein
MTVGGSLPVGEVAFQPSLKLLIRLAIYALKICSIYHRQRRLGCLFTREWSQYQLVTQVVTYPEESHSKLDSGSLLADLSVQVEFRIGR